jgi:hypothetical protein
VSSSGTRLLHALSSRGVALSSENWTPPPGTEHRSFPSPLSAGRWEAARRVRDQKVVMGHLPHLEKWVGNVVPSWRNSATRRAQPHHVAHVGIDCVGS